MHLMVTSASGINGAGYGKLLAFDLSGQLLGPFTEDTRVSDPRGLGIQGGLLFLNSGADRVLALDGKGQVVRDSGVIARLNPGGGNFGPDGRYYVGARNLRTIMAFEPGLTSASEPALPPFVVPFPRGFAFGNDGTLFLASGIGPGGEGDNTILAFDLERRIIPSWKVVDAELSPLDLAIAPNGNVVVCSEHPFGVPDALTTVREYDRIDGHIVRVLAPDPPTRFEKPRGLRFGPDGWLYCVAQNNVVVFDFADGKCLGAFINLADLYGQALIFFE